MLVGNITLGNMTKNLTTGIRLSAPTRSLLSRRGVGVQRVFDIGLSALLLSAQCPLASTCIYVHTTGEKFSRSDLPCERATPPTAQETRPLGWSLCPIRAAFNGQKENDKRMCEPGRDPLAITDQVHGPDAS